MGTKKLICWHCGGTLKGTLMPITRFTECRQCEADLHACMMCKFYDSQLLGECSHDRADRVIDKTHANFCTHFRPRRDAHQPRMNTRSEAAREELDALFGITPEDDAPAASSADRHRIEVERARAELDALFGVEKKTSAEGDE